MLKANDHNLKEKLIQARELRKHGLYDKAILNYNDALKEALKISNNMITESVIEIKSDIALSYFEQGNYETALFSYNSIAEEIENNLENVSKFPRGIILLNNAFIQIAMVYLIQDNSTEASKFRLKIYGIIKKFKYDTHEIEKRTQTVQYKSIEASILRLNKDWERSTAKYKEVVDLCGKIRTKYRSIGAYQRYAKANFNLSRSAAEAKNFDLMLSSIKEAKRIASKYLKTDHPETCRYAIEYARALRIKATILKPIGEKPESLIILAKQELLAITKQHELYLADEKFTNNLTDADLLEHKYLLEELESIDIQLKNGDEIGVRYERNAILVHKKMPYLALDFIDKAFFYFDKVTEPKDASISCNRILNLKAKVLSSLNIPDHTGAIIAAKKASQYLGKEIDSQELAMNSKTWLNFFNNWRLEWVIQWNWCVKSYREFYNNWYKAQFEKDDIYHQRNSQLVILPIDRVKLMMIVSRLRMLIDQAYLYCIEKTTSASKSGRRNLFFPIAHTKSHLSSIWKKQGVEKLIERPYMSDLKKAIIKIQPFNSSASKNNWLFNLNTINNFNKHSHIGVQSMPKQSMIEKRGLIMKRFKDMQIGVCRTNRMIYPHMLAHMFPGYNEVSTFAFLSDSSIQLINIRESFDWYGELNMQLDPVKDYIKALKDVKGMQKARTAYNNYFKLVKKAFEISSFQESDLHRLTEYLLNLAAQSEGLVLTSDKIELTAFIENTFVGVAGILSSAAKIHACPINFELANIQRDVRKITIGENIDELFDTSLTNYLSSKKLDDLRFLDYYARHIARSYIINGDTQTASKHMHKLMAIVPYWLKYDYNDLLFHLNQSPKKVINSSITNDKSWHIIDDDIIARIVTIEEIIFYKLPLNLFRHGNKAKYKFTNELVNACTVIHYILDQTWMRLYDRTFGAISGRSSGILSKYPANNDQAKATIKQLQASSAKLIFPTELQKIILSSMTWWESLRETALKLKHSSIKEILLIANNALGDEAVSILDVKSDNYAFKKTKIKTVQQMCKLRMAFDSTAQFVSEAFKFIEKNQVSINLFDHMKKLEKFQRVSSSTFYSDAALVNSAQQSVHLEDGLSSLGLGLLDK